MRVNAIFRRIEMEHSNDEEIVSFGDITINSGEKSRLLSRCGFSFNSYGNIFPALSDDA